MILLSKLASILPIAKGSIQLPRKTIDTATVSDMQVVKVSREEYKSLLKEMVYIYSMLPAVGPSHTKRTMLQMRIIKKEMRSKACLLLPEKYRNNTDKVDIVYNALFEDLNGGIPRFNVVNGQHDNSKPKSI